MFFHSLLGTRQSPLKGLLRRQFCILHPTLLAESQIDLLDVYDVPRFAMRENLGDKKKATEANGFPNFKRNNAAWSGGLFNRSSVGN